MRYPSGKKTSRFQVERLEGRIALSAPEVFKVDNTFDQVFVEQICDLAGVTQHDQGVQVVHIDQNAGTGVLRSTVTNDATGHEATFLQAGRNTFGPEPGTFTGRTVLINPSAPILDIRGKAVVAFTSEGYQVLEHHGRLVDITEQLCQQFGGTAEH